MQIENCTDNDFNTILFLYDAARKLQASKEMVVWPEFENKLIDKEIREKRQWKILIDGIMACNWAIAYEDKDIWEEKEKGDAIYIHRIATHPDYRGLNLVKDIVAWARQHARQKNKKYIRLDTLGNNKRLIKHYTSCGFTFLGMVKLANTSNLPGHYQAEPNCCLFELCVN